MPRLREYAHWSRMASEGVIRVLRDLPLSRSCEWARLQALRSVAARAAQDVDVDQVRKVLTSFPSTSAAPSPGLRSSNLKEALALCAPRRGACCRAPLRFPRGHRAFRKPSSTLRSIAIGDTLRRLTGTIAFDRQRLGQERARAAASRRAALHMDARPSCAQHVNSSTGHPKRFQHSRPLRHPRGRPHTFLHQRPVGRLVLLERQHTVHRH